MKRSENGCREQRKGGREARGERGGPEIDHHTRSFENPYNDWVTLEKKGIEETGKGRDLKANNRG